MTTPLDNLTDTTADVEYKHAVAMWVQLGRDPHDVDETWLAGLALLRGYQSTTTVSTDAWASGFVLATAGLTAAALELVAVAHRRRDARRRRCDVEPIPWHELEHYR